MRARAVRLIAWGMRNWPRIRRVVAKAAMFVGGVAILHREIYEVQSAEPLLVFLGLWLVGIAPAQFFDGLKKMGQEAKGSLDAAADTAPKPPAPTPPTDQLTFGNGDA